MHRLTIVASIVALTACSPRAPGTAEPEMSEQPMTAAHLSNLMTADGEAHTVAVLTGPAAPDGLDPVFAGIATGDAEWLAVAARLRPVVDGEHASTLENALSQALPINPTGVLTALAASGGSSEAVCEATDSSATVAEVQAVTDPQLQAVKAECLRNMRVP